MRSMLSTTQATTLNVSVFDFSSVTDVSNKFAGSPITCFKDGLNTTTIPATVDKLLLEIDPSIVNDLDQATYDLMIDTATSGLGSGHNWAGSTTCP